MGSGCVGNARADGEEPHPSARFARGHPPRFGEGPGWLRPHSRVSVIPDSKRYAMLPGVIARSYGRARQIAACGDMGLHRGTVPMAYFGMISPPTCGPVAGARNFRVARAAGTAIVLLALALTTSFLSGCNSGPQWHETDLTGAMPALDFTMTRAEDGKTVTADDFKGKVVLLYFGYTSAPTSARRRSSISPPPSRTSATRRRTCGCCSSPSIRIAIRWRC